MDVLLHAVYFEKPLSEDFRKRAFSLLAPEHLAENQSYRLQADRDRNLLGKMLVALGWSELTGRATDLSEWKTDLYKRPFLGDGFDFNVTHSGNLVACGFCERPSYLVEKLHSDYSKLPSDKPLNPALGSAAKTFPPAIIGVDIEELRLINFELLSNYMNATEWTEIKSSKEPNRVFLDYWTAKESVMKACGRGMYLPVELIDIKASVALAPGCFWHLNRPNMHKTYRDCLATAFEPENIISKNWTPGQLYEVLKSQ